MLQTGVSTRGRLFLVRCPRGDPNGHHAPCWQPGSPALGVAPSCEVDGGQGVRDGRPPQRTAEACGGGAERGGSARSSRLPTGTEHLLWQARSTSRCLMTKQRLLEGASGPAPRCSSTAVDIVEPWSLDGFALQLGEELGPQSPRWVLPVNHEIPKGSGCAAVSSASGGGRAALATIKASSLPRR